MGTTFVAVTITAAGTPQELSKATVPALPSVVSQGLTIPINMTYQQVTIQAHPSNTGNIFIGGPALNKGTSANVGAVLIPGASLVLGYGERGVSLDDLWADTATNNNIVLLTLVG
jgi:hypothetical protein